MGGPGGLGVLSRTWQRIRQHSCCANLWAPHKPPPPGTGPPAPQGRAYASLIGECWLPSSCRPKLGAMPHICMACLQSICLQLWACTCRTSGTHGARYTAQTNKQTKKTDRTSRQTQAGIGHSAPAHRGCESCHPLTSCKAHEPYCLACCLQIPDSD